MKSFILIYSIFCFYFILIVKGFKVIFLGEKEFEKEFQSKSLHFLFEILLFLSQSSQTS